MNLLDAITEAEKTRKNFRLSALPQKDELLRLFSYDPLTGILTNRTSSKNGKRLAGTAVCTFVKGYFKVCIAQREFYVHRIIWKLMTGEDPVVVDHINGVGTDNRWCNLRSVQQYQNIGVAKLSRHNKSGVKGVYWSKTKHKWAAQISIGDKIRYLGRFDSLDAAKAAYDAAASLHFGMEKTA